MTSLASWSGPRGEQARRVVMARDGTRIAKLDNCLQSRAPLSHFFLACDVSLGSNIWFHVKGKSKLFHDFAMLQGSPDQSHKAQLG